MIRRRGGPVVGAITGGEAEVGGSGGLAVVPWRRRDGISPNVDDVFGGSGGGRGGEGGGDDGGEDFGGGWGVEDDDPL